jgi:hypothetical protein
MTPQLVEVVAIVACTLFTGAAIYITAMEHPARLSCGADAAVAEWAPSYKRATFMQVPFALIAGLFGIVRGTRTALGLGSNAHSRGYSVHAACDSPDEQPAARSRSSIG